LSGRDAAEVGTAAMAGVEEWKSNDVEKWLEVVERDQKAIAAGFKDSTQGGRYRAVTVARRDAAVDAAGSSRRVAEGAGRVAGVVDVLFIAGDVINAYRCERPGAAVEEGVVGFAGLVAGDLGAAAGATLCAGTGPGVVVCAALGAYYGGESGSNLARRFFHENYDPCRDLLVAMSTDNEFGTNSDQSASYASDYYSSCLASIGR